MRELIALLKANPGKHSYATPGVGSPPHLGGEWLYKVTYGLDVVHVPFQGAAPAITSTIAGHTSLVHMAMPALTPHVQDGKLRAIVADRRQTRARLARRADAGGVRPAGVSHRVHHGRGGAGRNAEGDRSACCMPESPSF